VGLQARSSIRTVRTLIAVRAHMANRLWQTGSYGELTLANRLRRIGIWQTGIWRNVVFPLISIFRTPTEEILQLLSGLLQNIYWKADHHKEILRNLIIPFSDLLYRVCINPDTKTSQFPIKVYGEFCNSKHNKALNVRKLIQN